MLIYAPREDVAGACGVVRASPAMLNFRHHIGNNAPVKAARGNGRGVSPLMRCKRWSTRLRNCRIPSQISGRTSRPMGAILLAKPATRLARHTRVKRQRRASRAAPSGQWTTWRQIAFKMAWPSIASIQENFSTSSLSGSGSAPRQCRTQVGGACRFSEGWNARRPAQFDLERSRRDLYDKTYPGVNWTEEVIAAQLEGSRRRIWPVVHVHDRQPR